MNSTQPENDGYFYYIIGLSNNVLAAFVVISYGLAWAITSSYFQNVSLAKECILLKMYQDVISSLLWNNCLWMMRQILANWNKKGMNKVIAMIVSFCISYGTIYLFLTITLISIYTFYMAKTKMLDPPIPMIGGDEESVMKIIRGSFFLVSVVFLTITYGLGLYPSFFYSMIPDQIPEDTELMANLVYRVPYLLLMTITGIFAIAKAFYKEDPMTIIDSIIPKAIKCIGVLMAVLLGGLIILEALPSMDEKKKWAIFQLIASLVKLVLPFALISRSNQLKSHSTKFLKELYDDAFMLMLYLVPSTVFIVMNMALFILF